MNAKLSGLLDAAGAILLDFDGPVCSIFAGYPAPQVAAGLAAILRDRGTGIPLDVLSGGDPLEVLRYVGAAGDADTTQAVEDALCSAELRAVESAEPTPYGREVIVSARQAGLPLAVVSNNSAAAVSAYLAAHRLSVHVSPVVGRAYAAPEQMKPNPAPIQQAVRAIGETPERCVLIGDSLADIHGAKAAGVHVIGYANRPAKLKTFRAAGADVVVTSMRDIAGALTARLGTQES